VWVVGHIWMSPVTYMNEYCHVHEWVVWVMGRIWLSSGTHANESCESETYTNESCRTCKWVVWVMRLIWMSRGTYLNEACHIYEWVAWVMGHIWMSSVTRANESCESWDISECVLSHMQTRLIFADILQQRLHQSLQRRCNNAATYVTCHNDTPLLSQGCDVTHTCVRHVTRWWHNSYICVAHICNNVCNDAATTLQHIWHAKCVTYLSCR